MDYKEAKSSSKRMPYGKTLLIQSHRRNSIHKSDYKHLSLVIGNSQQGKDTLIQSFDPQLEKSNKVRIGDGNKSCTTEFQYIDYKCESLIGSNQGVMLNTVGLGDPGLKMTDAEIVTEIYNEMMHNASSNCGGVHTFYFVQGLDSAPVTQIERSLIYMQAALGDSIFKSSVIIATKGNKLDEDELEDKMSELSKLADKYRIKGGVIDYRCPFKKKFKQETTWVTPISDEDFQLTHEELHGCLQGLDFFDTKPLLNELQGQIKKIQEEIKLNCKQTKEKVVKKERIERRFYTIWLFPHKTTYYDKEYEIIFTKTDPQILEEAKERALKKGIQDMKSKLNDLNQRVEK